MPKPRVGSSVSPAMAFGYLRYGATGVCPFRFNASICVAVYRFEFQSVIHTKYNICKRSTEPLPGAGLRAVGLRLARIFHQATRVCLQVPLCSQSWPAWSAPKLDLGLRGFWRALAGHIGHARLANRMIYWRHRSSPICLAQSAAIIPRPDEISGLTSILQFDRSAHSAPARCHLVFIAGSLSAIANHRDAALRIFDSPNSPKP